MTDLTSQVELNDSDILEIEGVVTALNLKQGEYHNLEGFQREIIERFEDIGLKVQIQVFETDMRDAYAFDIDIVERLEGAFDIEKMVEETVQDVLDLGEGGVITPDGVKEPSKKLYRPRWFKKKVE